MSARVVITGAASGIGAATAEQLRRRGARVIGLDIHADGEDLILCDVCDQDSVDAAMKQAADGLGGIDVLINCAGIGLPQSAGERPGPDALKVIDVNLLGTWRVAAAALPALRESRGRVINIASGLAHLSAPLATAYCMSKRGVVSYSDLLRLEHGDAIRVTTVYPGYIRTPIHDASAEAGVTLEGLVPAEPLESAAATLVRVALDSDPPRDVATTRQGGVGYFLLRFAPKWLVERMVLARIRRAARTGAFEHSELASPLRRRLLDAA